MKDNVSAYIASTPSPQGSILTALRKVIKTSVPDAAEEFKWGRPVYRARKNFAYLKAEKSYVTLGFYDASALKDPKELLEGTGAAMKHLKVRSLAEVDEALLSRWLKAAAKAV